MELLTKERSAGLAYASYSSLLGDIFVLGSNEGLLELRLGTSEDAFMEQSLEDYGLRIRKSQQGFCELFTLLDDYFHGKKVDFVVDLKPVGSPFELSVWHALRSIPYGQCRSYSWVAEAAEGVSPRAQRAVGRACGRNPLPIIIPCHRVIRASGDIGGFAGAAGGVVMKRRLLELEGLTLP